MTTEKRVFALGFFDGVHLGHQALLRECVALARSLDARPAAITFDRHPLSLFAPAPPLLTTTEDRIRLLGYYGMDPVYPLSVSEKVMSTPWREFLCRLVENGACGFVCGDDFHFGSRGEGNAVLLAQFCREWDLSCVIVPEQTMDDVRVSSTYIRRQLETGHMATAVRFLGHPHILTGEVVHGQRLGRKLGFPTANLRLPEGIAAPKFGVYVCRCLVDGRQYPAVTNIGTRPTVSGTGVTVESWILDYAGDLYGREITLEFYRFLRPERKFDSLEDLRAQIHQDAGETRRVLENLP